MLIFFFILINKVLFSKLITEIIHISLLHPKDGGGDCANYCIGHSEDYHQDSDFDHISQSQCVDF